MDRELYKMLLFAHMGLTLAAARPMSGAIWSYLLLGSILPDIIDKPLGELLFGNPAMGRTFAHTILFLLSLCLTAYYRHDLRMASLSSGVLFHLLLDSMWNSPHTVLWPLLGGFPPAPYLSTTDYLQLLIGGLRDPSICVPEVLGLSYLIYFALSNRDGVLCSIRQKLEQMPLLSERIWG